MLGQLSTLNRSVERFLESVSVMTREVDSMVGDAVRSLQFEDIATQLAACSERHLDRIDGLVRRVHGEAVRAAQSRGPGPGDFV